MKKTRTMLAALAVGLLTSTAAIAGDVRIMWYSDGVEGEVLKDLLDRFMKENPGINVILDNVSYSVVREQLPVQLEAGNGPDIARVTNLKAQSQHWLDLRPLVADAAYWDENFGAQADWMRPDGSNQISGFMTQITIAGGFANKTLFDQAGIAIPGKDATWDDWAKAAKQVAENQQVPFPMALDRSGHRLSGPNLAYGGNYVGADGKPAPLDDGTKTFLKTFVGWVADGTMSKDVWVSAAGSTYRAAADDFINGQLVYYYSGSWQVPNFSTKIGTNFDWVATGSPCGPTNCTGMTGGAGLVAVKYTKNPKEVAKVMDYLASEPVVKEFSERTLFLPAHKGVLAKGLDFKTDDAQAKAALNGFVEAGKSLSDAARKLPGWLWSDTFYGALVTRVSQAAAGEMTVDEAFTRIDSDIATKVKDSGN
ncbi:MULTISPECIES: ABC transporter substrate-binding protein [unclassified Ensifer]|uniref:ABC transporter substrate-binding protein n=1 Tax=unclassified Ensifer TaxID=2633371 RepID=UPI00081326D4|nr:MULTISPECIES: ABC transporter substrate-binding protein [unclassified Ensifer]OCO99936.1 ABC transporter substrate-binding protein [Ensifer sp. LC13]OCP00123.1 ABC transporter substrate-binding protein [Ensifer sp. LC11]OCP04022.1 ABC transporter substrate-binding protein [Ensifer sp. LC14]OCP31015.1 ABC transporter substrate-binding protein [Ensifer sp. LC499]